MPKLNVTRDNKTISDRDWQNDVTFHIKQLWVRLGEVFANIVFPVGQGKGIKIDTNQPTWGWVDMLGQISPDTSTGSTKPTFEVYNGGIRQWRFAVGDEVFVEYHIPHDYAVGTDLFIHTHWSILGGNLGNVTWNFEVTYAKGHNQAPFSAPVTVMAQELSSTTPRQHMITEVQLSSLGGGLNLLDTNDIEIDGLLLVRVILANNATGESPFLHYADVHYQSTGIATKNKSPDFYI